MSCGVRISSSLDETRREPTRRKPAPARQTQQAARDKQPSPPRQAAQTFVCAIVICTLLASCWLASCCDSQPAAFAVRWCHLQLLVELLLIMISAPLFKITRILQPYCMILLCCSLLLQYLYYQVLLLISTGTVLVYMYWYCRSIAQVHACERPTGYIKYESLVRMTLNPTHESIPLDSMCAT